MTDDAREQLADVLYGTMGAEVWGKLDAEELADALLPIVERIARQRAANELDALEREALRDPTRSIQRIAQDRAAALRGDRG